MDIVWFTLIGASLYLIADWMVRQIEAHRGKLLPYRSLVFFAIILVLAFATFQLINIMEGSTPPAEPAEGNTPAAEQPDAVN